MDDQIVIYGADGKAARVLNSTNSGVNANFGWNPFGSPQSSNFHGQAMLSNVDTFQKNLRYYFISNFRQVVSQSYVEYGLIRTIVDVPVDDGYRGGVTFKTDQLDETDLKKMVKFMRAKRDLKIASEGQKWGRLFGGGAILCLVDDQDPEEPLEIEKINKNSNVEFRAVDLWELSPNAMATQVGSPGAEGLGYDYFMYYGEKIHKSRLKKIMGLAVPSFDRPRLRGWGASVLETLIRSINQYLKGTDLAFEVLDEFKLDVYMIKGWLSALSTVEGEAIATRRIHYANGRKNFQNATILDSEDEFQQRQLSFAGLGEVMQGIRLQVASDLRMPLTKVFGISAAGFSTGQEDLENYNMMVEGTIREDSEDIVNWMATIRCQELFGNVPDDLEGEFKPLRVLGGVDEQSIKTAKATILDQARTRGDITLKEYREGINASKAMDIQLDTSDAMITELEEVADEKAEAAQDALEGGEEGKGAEAKDKSAAPKTPQAKAKGKPVGNQVLSFLQRVLNIANQNPQIVTVGILNGSNILTGKRRDNGLQVSPGGHMDQGETPEQAAIREVMEESGIEISESNLEKISTKTITSPRTGKDFILHAYLAKVDHESPTTKNDPDKEITEWKWVKLDPATPELMPESRHAKDDEILNHLFKK